MIAVSLSLRQTKFWSQLFSKASVRLRTWGILSWIEPSAGHLRGPGRHVSHILPVEDRVLGCGSRVQNARELRFLLGGAGRHVLYIHRFKILSGYQRGVDWLFCPARYRKLGPPAHPPKPFGPFTGQDLPNLPPCLHRITTHPTCQ